jgi:hypothetical protein
MRDNLEARIIDAKREGWFGEVEGLQVSYSGVKDKLAQIDAVLQRQTDVRALVGLFMARRPSPVSRRGVAMACGACFY